MSKSSVNLCLAASTSSGLLEAQPGHGTLLDRHQVYIAVVRSVLEYAVTAWVPWLSTTTITKLKGVQLETASAITSQDRSTPVEAVLAESQLLPISTRFQTMSLLNTDEWAHLHHTVKCYKRQILVIHNKRIILLSYFIPLDVTEANLQIIQTIFIHYSNNHCR